MTNQQQSDAGRDELRKELLRDRREFIKRTMAAGLVAAPVIASFASKDLVRASSCPGVGNCGNNMANPANNGKGGR